MMTSEPPYADVLRRLAFNDVRTVDSVLAGSIDFTDDLELGDKTVSLLRVAALIASDAATSSYQWAVATALATGATENEIVAVLLRIAPIVGVARVASAARSLSGALGVELDELERD
jgi:alkylhydroperoxidase/carboxymuconolactone decarboxylase family protein YurZ